MIKSFLTLLVCIVWSVNAQQLNTELLSNLDQYHSVGYNDIWGYTDQAGNEYALLGVYTGTSVIDITDPHNPVEVAFVNGPNSIWRDIKTHDHYMYMVSEGGSGLQIVDLNSLPDSVTDLGSNTTYFSTAHNLFIADGYAYVVRTDNGGGIHILNLSNPASPVETAYYSSSGNVHDVYVFNDTAYASAEDSYDLVDVSDKLNPQLVSQSSALPGIYAHSGWLTEDKRYFIGCEESNVRDLTVWDLQDRTTWDLVVPAWQMPENTPVHNVFIRGHYAYISYYNDGFVCLDVSDPTNPEYVGRYDTFPGTTGGYEGAWGCYPFFPSGNVIISDRNTGLYVLDFLLDNVPVEVKIDTPVDYSLKQNFPNPFNPSTFIECNIAVASHVKLIVYNTLGQKVKTLIDEFKPAGRYQVHFNAEGLASGIYIARIQAGEFTRIIKMNLLK